MTYPKKILHYLVSGICPLIITCFCYSSPLAYTIKTGLSDGCHETMTADLIVDFINKDMPNVEELVPTPPNNLWERFGDVLLGGLTLEFDSPLGKFMGISLIIGARWPDEQGRSVTNTEALYANHGSPIDQHEHCLRTQDEDYDEGNIIALDKAKAFTRDQLDLAMDYLARPQDEQIIEITEYVDFYGKVKIAVWAPAYYVGTAIHTIQDSFAHALRSDDLKRIIHVMNFIDTVTSSYDVHKDGLAHSYAMDRCNEEAKELAVSAILATEQILEIFVSESSTVVDELFDEWFTYEPGCHVDNDFCNSKWLDIAHTDPTGPVMETLFGCEVVPNPNSELSGIALLFFAFGLILWGQRRRKS